MKKKSTSETEIIIFRIRGLDHGLDRFNSYSPLNHKVYENIKVSHISTKSEIIISGVFGRKEGM